MRIKQRVNAITPAAPITTADVRLYGRVPNISSEDSMIEQMIGAAVRWVEQYIGKAINTNTYTLDLWSYHDDRDLEGNDIYIELTGPVSSITSVKGYDSDNTESVLVADTDYFLLKGDRLRIVSASSYESLQVVYVAAMDSVEITDNIKEAILKLTEELYKHRGISVTGTIVTNLKANLASLLDRERTKLNW